MLPINYFKFAAANLTTMRDSAKSLGRSHHVEAWLSPSHERVGKALQLPKDGLKPFIKRELKIYAEGGEEFLECLDSTPTKVRRAL